MLPLSMVRTVVHTHCKAKSATVRVVPDDRQRFKQNGYPVFSLPAKAAVRSMEKARRCETRKFVRFKMGYTTIIRKLEYECRE